jgi:hypothetical protein
VCVRGGFTAAVEIPAAGVAADDARIETLTPKETGNEHHS